MRGANSLSLSNEPLLIVDGVRVNNDVGNREQAAVSGEHARHQRRTGGQTVSRLNDINPEDIETIDVIRGPSGVALYGTAAANGVIQITTKRGRAGRTQWTAHFEAGRSTNETEFPDNVAMRGPMPPAPSSSATSIRGRAGSARRKKWCRAIRSRI